MADIATRDITFQTTIGEARGYLACPSEAIDAGPSGAGEDGKFPGIMLIHEWWGLNDHTKDIARRFAAEGYVTLAPDLYNGKVTADPDEANKLMGALNNENALATMIGALECLDQEHSVHRIGVVGFCMGGSMTMLVGCHTNRISALVPFYGGHPPEEELARVHAPILFIGAEDDQWVSKAVIEDLRTILQKRHKEFEIIVPPGTKHAFFNNTRPEVYNADAAAAMWTKALGFLEEQLKNKVHERAGVNPTWPPDIRT